ncbi:MAG: hypothetical protein K8I82_05445, partial [Anaerolineae bacterium]|nr:hypothetical protein [Anaerolineae bacterium]
AVVFNADDTQLITVGNVVQSWSPSGEAVAVVESPPTVLVDALPETKLSHIPAVAWHYQLSPDGRYLLSRGDETWTVWETTSGTPLYDLGYVDAAAFSPDGNTLAVATSGQIQRLDITTGMAQSAFNVDGFIASMNFSDEITLVLPMCIDVCALEFWDVTSGVKKSGVPVPPEIVFLFEAILSADGRHALVDGTDTQGANVIMILDVTTGQVTHAFDQYRRRSLDAGGRMLIAEGGFLHIYDPASFTEVNSIPLPSDYGGFAISGDGRRIVFLSGETTLQILDYESQSLLTTLEIDQPVHSFELNHTGSHVLVMLRGDDLYEVEIWAPQP